MPTLRHLNSLCKNDFTNKHKDFWVEEIDASELAYLDSENEDSIKELEKKSIKELCGDLLEEILMRKKIHQVMPREGAKDQISHVLSHIKGRLVG